MRSSRPERCGARRRAARGASPLLALLAVACGDATVAASGERSSLAVAADDRAEFGTVPAFELVDQGGRPFSLSDLAGRPFALAAIFTTCAGPCPSMTANMRWLQDELAGTDVGLVSVSVDAEIDTPEVLAAYAARHGADPQRWSFLTGEEPAIHRLLREGFWLGVEREVEDAVLGIQVTHSALIVAVDGEGRRRGWYDGTSREAMEALRDRLLFLARAGA